MRGTKYLTLAAGLILASPALALTGTDGPAHGMAMHGEVKYGPAFAHFDYVIRVPRRAAKTYDVRSAPLTALTPSSFRGTPLPGLA
jgi:microcin C transport system substrate-binding protein